jgi:hypothetical protein
MRSSVSVPTIVTPPSARISKLSTHAAPSLRDAQRTALRDWMARSQAVRADPCRPGDARAPLTRSSPALRIAGHADSAMRTCASASRNRPDALSARADADRSSRCSSAPGSSARCTARSPLLPQRPSNQQRDEHDDSAQAPAEVEHERDHRCARFSRSARTRTPIDCFALRFERELPTCRCLPPGSTRWILYGLPPLPLRTR